MVEHGQRQQFPEQPPPDWRCQDEEHWSTKSGFVSKTVESFTSHLELHIDLGKHFK